MITAKNAAVLQVFLGLHDANNKHKADSRSVDKVVLHPHFQPNNYNNDIALIRLTEAVEFNSYIRPVCLPSPNDEVRDIDQPTNHLSANPNTHQSIKQSVNQLINQSINLLFQPNSSSLLPNSLGVVAGWGISNPNSTFSSSSPPTSVTTANFDPGLTSDILQYVKLPVVSQGECRASYSSRSVSYNITDNMFCAGFFEGGRDTCLGDSGGAFVTEDQLTRRWVVSGLVSWGGPEECGSRRVYGVYTRVASYVEWIEKHLQIFP